MFEKELTLAEHFIQCEIYGQSGDPTKFLVQRRSACYITFLTNSGNTYKKRIRYDDEGNEYVEWKNDEGAYYVLSATHKI